MQLTALRGELRVAGRWAASLDHVDARIEAGDAYSLTGHVTSQDDYWMQSASTFDVILSVGERTWRWRRVSVALVGDSFRISGQGRPEII